MESQFSNQVDGSTPNGIPNPPMIGETMFQNGVASLYVTLPETDDDGGPLTGLTHCYVFYKETSFDGSTPAQERAAGTPCVTTPVTPGQGVIVVQVPGLVYGKTYYFVASCDD